jgi:hypothetical protein
MIEVGVVDESFHMAFVKQVVAAGETIFPVFDIGPNGERVVNTSVAAALLGDKMDTVNARALALGVTNGARDATNK